MQDISVIIATKNEQEYIAHTLTHLRLAAEEAKKLNVTCEIVVIDSSNDDTKKIAQKFTKKVYTFPAMGVSRARNFGVSHATGRILVFMDADTIVQRDTLLEVCRLFQNKAAVSALTYVMPLDYDGQPFLGKLFYALDKLFIKSCAYFGLLIKFYNRGDTVAIRKSVFQAVGGFDEKLYMLEITDLLVKASRLGHARVLGDPVFETSRRLRKWGVLKSYRIWWRNYLTFYLLKRLHDRSYEVVR